MPNGSRPALLGAIEAGGTKFVCGIAGLDGRLLKCVRIPTGSPAETLEASARFFETATPTGAALAALSIGSFGPLSLRQDAADFGSITATPKPGWSGTDLLGFFRRRLGVPLTIDTDVNCAAMGEHLFGSGRDLDSLCYVTVGTGIGVGMIMAGAPHGGANHPEAGHIRVPRAPGDQRFAGICPFHKDCLEGLACGPAMSARWGADPLDLGDDHPGWAIEARYLAALCTNLTYILRPERIILGGGVMQRAHLFDSIRAAFRADIAGYDASLRDLDVSRYIAAPMAGSAAGLSGALAMAHHRVTNCWPVHWCGATNTG